MVDYKTLAGLIDEWVLTFSRCGHLDQDLVYETEKYLDYMLEVKTDYGKNSDKWNNFKAIKEFMSDFINIVRVKSLYEPNNHWKKMKVLFTWSWKWLKWFKQIPVEKILDSLWIEHRNWRCKCPIHEWNNPMAFSFKDELYQCFSCWSKGNWYQIAKLLNVDVKYF